MPFLATEHVPIPTKDLLSWIFDEPDYDQDKPIYIDARLPSRSISLRQARATIRKLAAGFHAMGVRKGDCICLHSFNDIMYSMIFLGIIAAGGCFAGSNPAYTQFELTHHVKTAKAKFIITEPEMLDNVVAVAKESNIPVSNILIFNVLNQPVPAGFESWSSLLQHGERDWPRFDDEKTARETTAARLFSSGTTGPPKAASLSHHNFVAQHTLFHEVKKETKDWEASRVFCLPMFHAATVPVAHTTTLKAGNVAYIMRRFDLEEWLSYIQKYKITEVGVVPPLAIAVIMSPATKKYSLQSIRAAAIGAAPLGPGPQKRLRDLLAKEPKPAVCNQVWGMTETSCVATMFRYPEDDETGSIGRALPCVDLKIIDDDGNDITGYDVRGELCVRGPIVINGYFDNPAANADSFDSAGFFKTGDIVYRASGSGKWYIVDRKKELIKVRGFQVAPPELESVLLAHPAIVDAAVIGVKTLVGEGKGEIVELPRAYVIRRPGKEGDKLDEKAVKAWCGERLAKYKELSGGVRFVDAIPKNASGKILKRVLREEAEREEKAKGSRL